jgi:hypothetical protein
MLQHFLQCFQVLPVDPGSSTRHADDMKRPKTPSETVADLAKLFDLYGLDRRPDRDRSLDGERNGMALYCAVRDGLLKLPPLPPRKRGAPAKWKGKLGLDLVNAVETVQVEHIKHFGRPMSVSKALEVVQQQNPGKFEVSDLEKRYYEARKAWPRGTRLKARFDL